jgi:hypothetical protein
VFTIQTKSILKLDWDILIILDACRFDKFKDISKNILQKANKIEKMISPATQTVEWLNKTFNGNYYPDIIYVSSNPFVNSKGIKAEQGGYEFNAKPCFKKIIDVWDTSWNPDVSTVHPLDVNKAAIVSLDLRKKYKHIIHYMQPHSPYIYYGGLKSHLHPIQNIQKNFIPANEFSIFSKIAKKVLSQETIWNICKFLGRQPTWDLGKLYVKYGREGIQKGYTEDLKLVLKHVKKIIELYPKKKIVITADHGERLGENGNYGHGGKREKEVIEVPWVNYN